MARPDLGLSLEVSLYYCVLLLVYDDITYHLGQVNDKYIIDHLSTLVPPKYYCTMIVYHGERKTAAGRWTCPTEIRGGPCPYGGKNNSDHAIMLVLLPT